MLNSGIFASMPASDLASLEQHLEACLLDLDALQRERPHLPNALARADAGQQIDELLEEIVKLQQSIDNGPAVTLQDAAVWIRGARLGYWGRRWQRWSGPRATTRYRAICTLPVRPS